MKFIFFDRFAPYDNTVFFTFTSTIGFKCVNGVKWVFSPNDPYIGFAAASYWLIGGSPSSKSIVRRNELVVCKVLSTTCRLVYGVTTNPVVRRAST